MKWARLSSRHSSARYSPSGNAISRGRDKGPERVPEIQLTDYRDKMRARIPALESIVRYIAAELGPKGIRVHAISPGPLATRAASGIPEFDALLDKAKAKAPARSLVSIDDVGVATAFLAHDAARLITGETLYIDGGYHIMD
jgi:enoyl-[acyl-carrier-protein] reductase (NADH)